MPPDHDAHAAPHAPRPGRALGRGHAPLPGRALACALLLGLAAVAGCGRSGLLGAGDAAADAPVVDAADAPDRRDARDAAHGPLPPGPPSGGASVQAPGWIDRTPSSLPAAWPRPRHGHAVAYDPRRGRLVLFGGADDKGPLDDTWEWDGASATWTDRTPQPRPPGWPAPRAWHAMTWDAAHGAVMMFGGARVVPFRETWLWDGRAGTWTLQQATAAEIPDAIISARTGHAMAFADDPRGGAVLIFGGNDDAGDVLSDLWSFDGPSRLWQPLAPVPRPRSWPLGRAGAAMARHEGRGSLIMFGGAGSGTLWDTWEWDGFAGLWIDRTPDDTPATSPPGRWQPGLAYVATRASVLLFGGADRDGRMGDTWEWPDARGRWVEHKASPSPPARKAHGMAWDPARRRVVLFGGSGSSRDLNDLWEWDGGG